MSTRILIVDDEVDLQELIKRRFRREIRHGEFEFAFASNGQQALDMIREGGGIDLVISDINMPRMDGLKLLEHLAEFEEQLKTVIISAYGDMENIRAAMNRGAFDFVTKPIDFQDLMITIKKSLDQLDILKEALEARVSAERARTNLARYVSPKLVDSLAARDEPFGPPREQEVGLLFVDIRGFTTLSERMKPSDVFAFLREFHTRMEAVVFDHDGTLDDYIGDAVFATFGVPETSDRDACNTISCAREMLRVIGEWNAERAKTGEPAVRAGIGVHYGSAVLGDIGSERLVNFTVIGDAVNLASRLEGMTRDFDCDIVASADLLERVKAESEESAAALLEGFEEAGEHKVRGRGGEVKLFTYTRMHQDGRRSRAS